MGSEEHKAEVPVPEIPLNNYKRYYIIDILENDNSITISIQDNLPESIIKADYEVELTLDQLKEMHPYFTSMETIKEIHDFFQSCLDKKELELDKVNDNLIKSTWMFENEKKFDLISIEVPIVPYTEDELVQKYEDSFYNLQNIFNKLRNINENEPPIYQIEFNYFVRDDKLVININDNTSSLPIQEDYSQSYSLDELRHINDFFETTATLDKVVQFFKVSQEKQLISIKREEKLNEENNQMETYMRVKVTFYKFHDKDTLILRIKKVNLETNEKIERYKERISQFSEYCDFFENEEQVDKIINFVNQEKKKVLSFDLLYRAKSDGDSIEVMHKKIDESGPSIVIIKTNDDKIIGGYTSKTWDSSNTFKRDKDAFLFDLDLNEKYKCINPRHAICCAKLFGPCFGKEFNLFICDKFFNSNKSFYAPKKYDASFEFPKIRKSLDNFYFTIVDMVIYQIDEKAIEEEQKKEEEEEVEEIL